MISRFLLALLILAVLPAGAAVIETSVYCGVTGQEEFGTRRCELSVGSYPTDFAEAGAGVDVGEEIPLPPYSYRAFIAAGVAGSAGGWNTATSSASATLTALFTTAGPSRAGWLDVSSVRDFEFNGSGASADGSVIIGPYSGSIFGPPNGRFPFTLGEPFPYELRATASVSIVGPEPGFGSFYGSHYVSTEVQFALYEADGVTPVTPTQVGVPEPAWLGAGGALLLIVVRMLRRRR